MKLRTLFRDLTVDLAIASVCAVVLMSLLGAKSNRLTARERERDELAGRIRTTAGAELVFARDGASEEDARRSVASVASFLRGRADLALDAAVADRLAGLERQTLAGRLRRLQVAEVGSIFAEVLCERVRDLKDDEIERAADEFGNVIPVGRLEALGTDLKARYAVAKRLRGRTGELAAKRSLEPRNGVQLRLDGSGTMAAEELVARLKEFRGRLQSPAMFALATAQAGSVLEGYLGERVAPIEAALPETWGGARLAGLTPVQVFVTAYASASDDPLVGTAADLSREQSLAVGRYLPAAGPLATERRPPFGPYGDLFSTPLDLVFDAGTLGRLLDRLEERAAR